MFLIRQARPGDHGQLRSLARALDSVNLPTDADELRALVERSVRSFAGRIRERSRAVYLFCAEAPGTGKLAGASMIIGKHGTPRAPHYYLEVDSDERYSHALRKMFRHSYLRLRYSMDGPTELGGLIVRRAMRRHPERAGQQLSWVRFLYIAKHRPRFERRVIAEMLPPRAPGYGNAFWDHYGGRVTGLTFRAADRLSSRDKQFIRELFPESPLYTFLLPDQVRAALGAVGDDTRGAVRLLERAGMKFMDQIDPFDGGPYYGAAVGDLEPVRNCRSYRIVSGAAAGDERRSYLIGREDQRGFRAAKGEAIAGEGHLVAAPEILALLRVHEGDRVDTVPLP
jgi:arginine N-succinyltransferase